MMGFNRFEEKLKEIQAAKIKALNLVGIFVRGEYVARLERGHHVVSGELVGSPSYKVTNDETVRIGTNVEYAGFVEHGTSNSRAYPCLRPSIDENRDKIKDLIAMPIRKIL